MNINKLVIKLKSLANPKNVAGMARFGITANNTLGISMPTLRKMAKEIGKDHNLAQQLWDSGIHEAKILASFIDDPKLVTAKQMDQWVADFDSWDVCDQVCGSLFDKTPFIHKKIFQWAKDKREFVRRTAFASIAWLAVHDKKAEDSYYTNFFPIIKRYATDERNFVKKAVNWALRQIGKRNKKLNKLALELSKEILKSDSKTAQWIAKDAIRELGAKGFI
ncbi:MAG: DNA alkylation repair protein [Candidatus Margulisiibacteriota bacterium]